MIGRAFSKILVAGVMLVATAGIWAVTDEATVIASQGGQHVTFGDIDHLVEKVPANARGHFLDSPTRIQDLITNLLMQKQLAAEGEAAGLGKEPEIAGLTGLARTEALAKARMKQFQDDMKKPDFSALAKEDYLAYKEQYATPATIEVQQILISAATHDDDVAKALAEKIQKQAQADPGSFDALVEKFSDADDKATTHGMLHYPANTDDPEITAAAMALGAVGSISAPIKTNHGYHVIKLVAKTPLHQKSFDEVRDQILARLDSEYVAKTTRNHLDELRNKPIDASPDLVASLRTRYEKTQPLPIPGTALPSKP